MKCTELIKTISESIPGLFICESNDRYTALSTPFLYPDGDIIEIFIFKSSDNSFILTDMGETLRYLFDHHADPYSSSKRREILVETLRYFNAEFTNGEIRKTVNDISELTDSIFLFGQCINRLTDLVFTRKQVIKYPFRDEVRAFLNKHHLTFEENHTIIGASGDSRVFDFAVWTPNKSLNLIHLLSTRNPAGTSNIVNRTVASWVDIMNKKSFEANRYSIIDDSFPVWQQKDINMLMLVSDVYLWSNKQTFLEKLKTA